MAWQEKTPWIRCTGQTGREVQRAGAKRQDGNASVKVAPAGPQGARGGLTLHLTLDGWERRCRMEERD